MVSKDLLILLYRRNYYKNALINKNLLLKKTYNQPWKDALVQKLI